MAEDGETAVDSEVLSDRERALIEQNDAMRQELYEQALIAHNFVLEPATYSRRYIYEDLQSANNHLFSPGYRPTQAEKLDKAIGRDNWTTLPSGEVEDTPDPTGQETPDITAWQNAKYYLFTRNLDEQKKSGSDLTADEVIAEVDRRFPRLGPDVQAEGRLADTDTGHLAAIEAAAVRDEPEPEHPAEPEPERQARHNAIEDAAVREQPRAELPEESEEGRRVRHEAIEAAATRDPLPGSEEWAAERRGASAIEDTMGRFDEDVRRRGY